MAASVVLASYQRPILNQDPTVASLPGGSNTNLLSGNAPIDGTLIAVLITDAPVDCQLISPSGSESRTSTTAAILSVPVAADGAWQLQVTADHGPVFHVSASVSLQPISTAVTLASVGSIFSAAGQLLVGTGPQGAELLPIGANGFVLTVGGADPSQLQWAPGGAGGAPINSPAFTGNPTAPTPAPGDNDTSIATTAFVAAVAGLVIPLSLIFGSTSATVNASGVWAATAAGAVVSSSLRCVGAPAGSNLVVQVLKNGSVQVTLTIVAGSTTADIDGTGWTFTTGDLISVNCTSAGSGTAATGCVVQITYTA